MAKEPSADPPQLEKLPSDPKASFAKPQDSHQSKLRLELISLGWKDSHTQSESNLGPRAELSEVPSEADQEYLSGISVNVDSEDELYETEETNIQLSEEMVELLQQLQSNPRFREIERRLESDPEATQQLLTLIETEYPALHRMLADQPRLLVAIMEGDMANFDDEDEEPFPSREANLTPEDQQNIQNA